MLGECRSKCEHIAGVPLKPELSEELHKVYLAKGVAATTAIEGNTLSEAEVRRQIDGTLHVPPSKEYLAQEVENILEGCNLILDEIASGQPARLTPERIRRLNRIVLNNLTLSNDRAIPGEFRDHSVGVGRYRGAPADECAYLVDRLCVWLNRLDLPSEFGMAEPILKAILAHIYIAWIHPFGDGNGRTARLLEVQILMGSGIPAPACQLLSNHYNQTRSEYYRQLEYASQSGGDLVPFLQYAVQGFRDGLVEQLQLIRRHQWDVAWVNYVHEAFQSRRSETDHRRRNLILELSKRPGGVTLAEIQEMSGPIARAYANKSIKTISRDVDELALMGLVVKDDRRIIPKKWVVLAFPVRAKPPEGKPS